MSAAAKLNHDMLICGLEALRAKLWAVIDTYHQNNNPAGAKICQGEVRRIEDQISLIQYLRDQNKA